MTDNAPLSRDVLIEAMSKGAKPKDQWRIGAEHEKFGFDKTTLARPAYDGPNGIKAMLEKNIIIDDIIDAYEKSPLHKLYLESGIKLINREKNTILSREQFEALTDFRSNLRSL